MVVGWNWNGGRDTRALWRRSAGVLIGVWGLGVGVLSGARITGKESL
jgi:hypothetical protein